ncbi:Uncharacterised protein [Vibrio cholerae]|nr:Uncharacterised protein [Vibrio cholerae]
MCMPSSSACGNMMCWCCNIPSICIPALLF